MARTPAAKRAAEVEIAEVYVVAGQEGQLTEVANRDGQDGVVDYSMQPGGGARWRSTDRRSWA